MALYRKRPVVIEARQTGIDYDTDLEIMAWCDAQLLRSPSYEREESALFVIPTLEGDMLVCSGDYVIKGVAGEFYPCKPEIFAASYEKVDNDGHP
jgi:hypothetical protein